MTTLAQTQAAITAAMGVAGELAEGQLSAGQLEQQAAEECRALFGTVIGPEDPLWELHVDVMRQTIALGGMSGEELAEWAVVFGKPPEPEPTTSWIEQALAMGDDEDDDG